MKVNDQKYVKYPSTPHITRSQSITEDDIVGDIETLIGKKVVISEKMDGEATSCYNDHIHARSLDSNNHPSRNYVKGLWSNFAWKIPEDMRICGENVYAKHSIYYDDLESYFLVYNVWKKDVCLDYDETKRVCKNLNLVHVPVLYVGRLTEQIVSDIINGLDTEKQEGIVIRNWNSFHYDDFEKNVFKWVRKNHVQTSEHWMKQEIIPNKLKGK